MHQKSLVVVYSSKVVVNGCKNRGLPAGFALGRTKTTNLKFGLIF